MLWSVQVVFYQRCSTCQNLNDNLVFVLIASYEWRVNSLLVVFIYLLERWMGGSGGKIIRFIFFYLQYRVKPNCFTCSFSSHMAYLLSQFLTKWYEMFYCSPFTTSHLSGLTNYFSDKEWAYCSSFLTLNKIERERIRCRHQESVLALYY